MTCSFYFSFHYVLIGSINNQYLTVLLCWGDLPRPRAMVLPLYSKLLKTIKHVYMCGVEGNRRL